MGECDVHLCVYVHGCVYKSKAMWRRRKFAKPLSFSLISCIILHFPSRPWEDNSCFGTGISLTQRDCDSLNCEPGIFLTFLEPCLVLIGCAWWPVTPIHEHRHYWTSCFSILLSLRVDMSKTCVIQKAKPFSL